MGNHARVRRVKVINWGTKSSSRPCYVVAMVLADPSWTVAEVTNSGIDECIAVLPGNGTATPLTVFHVGAKADPGAALEGAGWGGFIRNCFVDASPLGLTMDVRALSMNWCRGGVVERNQVQNVQWGGPYLDKANGRELIIRDNVYRNVRKGPLLNLGTKSGTQRTISAISFAAADGQWEGTVTSANHNLVQGDRVLLQCTPTALSGLFEVTQFVSGSQFKYRTPGPTGTFQSGTLEKVFGTRKVLIEGNTIELPSVSDAGSLTPIGIHIDDNNPSGQLTPEGPDYVHGEVLVRDNRIRYIDGALVGNETGYGLQLNGVKNLQVRDNVLEVAPPDPLRNERCGAVKYFNNRTPAGALIQGFNEDTDRKYDELETEVEDALVLAMLNDR